MAKSLELKEQGNRYFQSGDYLAAEGLYSKAIIADPQNPTLYTNRAMSRLRLSLWESVIADCQTCLSIAPDSMKAHYYLSQAFLHTKDYESALVHALRAHEICSKTNDKSLTQITATVLRCKKERWEHRERLRPKEAHVLEATVLDLLAKDADEMLADPSIGEFEKGLIREDNEQRMQQVRSVFERARTQPDRKREVPEWVIDDISFGIMVDPVMTKTGKSYERSAIMEHLRRQPTDPLTREPLVPSELRPNLALRQACEDFIQENGWAVDW
ncbi:Tetratricopeptide-like helical [Metarhizium album ARSEF 1941]|uniref:Tetratricopeptide-like helical n=1 Tax=Metarhizium album (strain ARSEF 1941) TaxID=1081103 RepID=A0A0B2WZW9_METAS|nr:Tetratricopeptide-like helical [Metarhizium album ARSEF 1941]KHN98982.1 Tetratricopeptide-like helical [Metarhizium album ARSEF 1941]